MSYFFTSLFNKSKPLSTLEKPSMSLSFEICPSTDYTQLNDCLKGLKIGTVQIANYETYTKQLDSLILQQSGIMTELDHRYIKHCEKQNKSMSMSLSDIEKMQAIGKIGHSPTLLMNKSDSNAILDSLKLESKSGFTSGHSTNCVSSGKWCYEVQLLTNGLMQIGWCQFVTSFTETEGVGDDITSYAFDGYRKVKWHAGKKEYGTCWECGDIIGVCIDLDKHTIEYFINGKSLGEAYNSIPVGKNIAYFPGCSLSKYEKCMFNFGQSPFHYIYPGYEPLDCPISEINGSLELTSKLIELLKSHLLDIIANEKIRLYEKMLLCHQPFSYIANVSFKDIFIWKTILSPFLYDLSKRNKNQFIGFFDMVLYQLSTHKQKCNFVIVLYDNLTNMIEEYSLIGEKGLSDWKHNIAVFIALFSVNSIVYLWGEGNPVNHLKCIFNSNTIHCSLFYDYINSKYEIKTSTESLSKVFKEIKRLYTNQLEEKNALIEREYSRNLSEILEILLIDKRKFDQDKTFKDYLNDIIRTFCSNDEQNLLNLLMKNPQIKRNKIIFSKNIYFNLLYLYINKYTNEPFEKMTTYPWFSRSNKESIYFDEVGIGGTIYHVTSEYIDSIDQNIIIQSDDFCFEYFHKLVRISNDLLTVIIMDMFEDDRTQNKKTTIQTIMNFEDGSTLFDHLLKGYFYLFSYHSQIILYQFSFYLIKYITWLKNKNAKVIYFIPNCVIELPFSAFKILTRVRSKVIYDKTERLKANKVSNYFQSDDYMQLIVNLYLSLFSDNTILNPEIREKLLFKINFFVSGDIITSCFEGNDQIFEHLIKGLLNNMNGDSRSLASSKILLKIINPLCFGNDNNTESNLLLTNLKKYFLGNFSVFNDFLINYSNYANQVMTDYTIHLTNLTKKLPQYTTEQKNSFTILIQEIYSSYTSMCDLLKIHEFFLFIFADEFLDVKTLGCGQFINILKNLSSRILAKPYINNLISISEKIQSILENNNKNINLLDLGYTVAGIITKVYNAKNTQYYLTFTKKLANLIDFSIEPFEELYLLLIAKVKDKKIIKQLSQFNAIIKEIKSLKESNTMTQSDYDKLVEEDKICIICYVNLADMELLPCKHKGCAECINQYRSEKDTCFICHTKIEDAKSILK